MTFCLIKKCDQSESCSDWGLACFMVPEVPAFSLLWNTRSQHFSFKILKDLCFKILNSEVWSVMFQKLISKPSKAELIILKFKIGTLKFIFGL